MEKNNLVDFVNEEDLEDILLYEVKIDSVERPFNQLLDNYYMIYYKTKYD